MSKALSMDSLDSLKSAFEGKSEQKNSNLDQLETK